MENVVYLVMDDYKKMQEEELLKTHHRLVQTIRDAQSELQELQNSCTHPHEYHRIKDTNPNGAAAIRKTCELCGGIVGYPTDEEIDAWAGIK